MAQEWCLVRMYIIMVRARDGRETGMAVGRYAYYAVDGNVARQHAVELIGQLLAVGYRLLGIEMCHHHVGMDTCVGASGTYHAHVAAHQKQQGALHFVLHRIAAGLHLPSVVGRAVVAEVYKVTLHQNKLGFLLRASLSESICSCFCEYSLRISA